VRCYACKWCKIDPISTEIDGIEALNPKCTYHEGNPQDVVWANDGHCACFEESEYSKLTRSESKGSSNTKEIH